MAEEYKYVLANENPSQENPKTYVINRSILYQTLTQKRPKHHGHDPMYVAGTTYKFQHPFCDPPLSRPRARGVVVTDVPPGLERGDSEVDHETPPCEVGEVGGVFPGVGVAVDGPGYD